MSLRIWPPPLRPIHTYLSSCTETPHSDPFSRLIGVHIALQVPLPDVAARLSILQTRLAKVPKAADVDLPALADATAGMTAADLTALCHQASLTLVRREVQQEIQAHQQQLQQKQQQGRIAQAAPLLLGANSATPSAASQGGEQCVLAGADTDAAAAGGEQSMHADVDAAEHGNDSNVLTAVDLAHAHGGARHSVSAEVAKRFDQLEEQLKSGSLAEATDTRGRSSLVEGLVKHTLQTKMFARIAVLQERLQEAAAFMVQQKAQLDAVGTVSTSSSGSEVSAGWDAIMAEVAALQEAGAAEVDQ